MAWAGCSRGCYAPSTLGSFLRVFRFGHVRQLDAVAARVTANLARAAPLLPGADQIAYVDVDDTVRQTYGYAKQGAGYGYTGVKGLNALLATVSTPLAAPIIVASRLRKGSADSGRGAHRLVADALKTTTACGGTGLVIVRADSAFYAAEVVAAIRRGRARFSITARKDLAVERAIASIPDRAWTPISYPTRGLRRAAGAVDLRRRSRRGAVHRVHLQTRGEAGDRAADRAAGPRRQPRPRHHE